MPAGRTDSEDGKPTPPTAIANSSIATQIHSATAISPTEKAAASISLGAVAITSGLSSVGPPPTLIVSHMSPAQSFLPAFATP